MVSCGRGGKPSLKHSTGSPNSFGGWGRAITNQQCEREETSVKEPMIDSKKL